MLSRKLIYGRYGRQGDFLLLDQDDSKFGEVFKIIKPETVVRLEGDKAGFFVKKIQWRGRDRFALIRLNENEVNLSTEDLIDICNSRQGFLLRNKVKIWWGLDDDQPNIPFAVAGKRRKRR